MAKKDFLKEFHQEYLDALNEIENKNPFPEYFYDQFLAGEVTIYQKISRKQKHLKKTGLGR